MRTPFATVNNKQLFQREPELARQRLDHLPELALLERLVSIEQRGYHHRVNGEHHQRNHQQETPNIQGYDGTRRHQNLHHAGDDRRGNGNRDQRALDDIADEGPHRRLVESVPLLEYEGRI